MLPYTITTWPNVLRARGPVRLYQSPSNFELSQQRLWYRCCLWEISQWLILIILGKWRLSRLYWFLHRLFQRLFLIIMAVWRSTYIYQTSVLEVILKSHQVTKNDQWRIPWGQQLITTAAGICASWAFERVFETTLAPRKKFDWKMSAWKKSQLNHQILIQYF